MLIGGVEFGAGVRIGAGSYLHGGDAPAVSIDADTVIGSKSSIHELTFTSATFGSNCVIGDRVVLHGPLLLGNIVSGGKGTVLFGPTVADNVKIGTGALAFGPISITEDVPDNTILVPPGMEFLIAPSHTDPSGTTRQSSLMRRQWQEARAAGGGGGIAILLHAFG